LAKGGQDNTVELGGILTGGTRTILTGHNGPVTCIAYSPDGKLIVTSSSDTNVRIWSTTSGDTLHVLSGHIQAATGQPLANFEGHHDAVLSVVHSPDGRQISSCGWISSVSFVRVWDAHSCEPLHILSGQREIFHCVAYSPDDHHIASSAWNGTIHLWDAHNGDSISTLSGHLDGVTSVIFSPTNNFIAAGGSDGTVRLWKAGGGLAGKFSEDYSTAISCIDISPISRLLVTGDGDGTVRLPDTLTGEQRAVLKGHTAVIIDVTISSCGERVASACRRETGGPGLVLEGHTGEISGVAYSPTGHQIASCSEDGAIRIWCSWTGSQLSVFEHTVGLHQVMFAPDGQDLIYISSGGGVSCWDLQSKLRVDRLQGIASNVNCYTMSPSGKLIATVDIDGLFQLWDLTFGSPLEICQTNLGLATCFKWVQSFDCMYLAIGGVRGALRVWSLVKQGTYVVQQLWSIGSNEPFLENTNLECAAGLSPVNFALLKQRGTITGSSSE
ncbi:hypothetical protein BGX29_006999, partial [Mortierella sp. GBA35]